MIIVVVEDGEDFQKTSRFMERYGERRDLIQPEVASRRGDNSGSRQKDCNSCQKLEDLLTVHSIFLYKLFCTTNLFVSSSYDQYASE